MTPLHDDDGETVRRWLGDYLCEHLRWWSGAYGLGWDDAAIAAHVREHHLVSRDWEELRRAAPREDALVRVWRGAAGEPRGLIWAHESVERFIRRKVGVIDWIYVDADARAEGLGRRMMRMAMAWMARRGLDGGEVFVTAANPAAVALYERSGFKVVDHRMLAPAGAVVME